MNINGPNQLDGIRSSDHYSQLYLRNTVNHPITPTAGKALSASVQFSGSVLGGSINQIEPVIDAKYFHRGLSPKHVVGVHFSGRYLTGFGGKTAAPFNRFYMGGENDVRGFDIWSITPIAFVPIEGTVALLNNDGTPRSSGSIIGSDGTPTFVQPLPETFLRISWYATPGGDNCPGREF